MAKEGGDNSEQLAQIVKAMPILVGLIAVGYASAAYFTLFKPRIGTIMEGGKYDLSVVDERLGADRQYLGELEEAIEGFRTVNSKHVAQVNEILPGVVSIPELYVQMNEVVSRNEMAMTSVSVQPLLEPGRGGVGIAQVTLTMVGGNYELLKLVLRDFERLVRLSDIKSVNFMGEGAYSLLMHVYYLNED